MPLDKSWFILPYELDELTSFSDSNIRFPDALPRKLIEAYTKEGDAVFDPFAGFGTTILTAQKIGRIGFGIEYDEKKIAFLEDKVIAPSHIYHGSSLEIDTFNLPMMDFSLSSPPYMRSFDTQNPLSNYTKEGSYAAYLDGIGRIYAQIKSIMKPGAPIMVEVSNTVDAKHPMTPLAWDVGKEISKHLYFERDFIFCFENGAIESNASQDTHSYCLLFRNQ